VNILDIEIVMMGENAIPPKYASEEASGMDIHACLSADLILAVGQWKLIPAGFAMSMPPGFEAQLRPRSGLAMKHGITVLNSPGTIDSDYRGEVKVIVINLGDREFTVEPGMRIAQMVIQKVYRGTLKEVNELNSSVRGSGGFGSTGK